MPSKRRRISGWPLRAACLLAAALPVALAGHHVASAGEPGEQPRSGDEAITLLYTMDAKGFLMTCG